MTASVPVPAWPRLSAVVRLPASASVALPLILTAVVYGPLLGNYFLSDDFLNLFQIRDLPLLDYLLTLHGGHILVTRNAFFALCSAAFGTNPLPYFALALATHLLNVWLLWRVLRQLTASARAAAFAAALWGTAPLNAGSLGWYAVYGHVVAATAILVVLTQVLDAAAAGAPPSRARRALWYLLALAAATSFGVGIGMAMALPAVIVLLVPRWRSWSRLPPLATLVVVVPALYLWLTGRARVPSEPSATAAYLSAALQRAVDLPRMLFHLIGYSGERLVLGYLPLPTRYPSPLGYAIGGVLLAATVAVVVRSSAAARRQMLAAWLLTVACYGMIVAGRVAFFHTSFGDIVAQARYHYAGGMALGLVIGIALGRAGDRGWPRAWMKTAALVAWALATVVAYGFSPPFDHNQEARQQAAAAAGWMRSRIRSAPPGAPVYLFNRPFAGLPPAWVPASEFPGWAGLFTIYFPDNVVDGRRVFFVELNPGVIAAHRQGRRTATLLVPPGEVPRPAAPDPPDRRR